VEVFGVDLFGDHSVQVAAATLLESALVLTLAVVLVLLSVRVAQQSAIRPTLAPVPMGPVHRISPLNHDADVSSARWLSDSLPTRAPPPSDPCQRFRPTPPGALRHRE
jgi:hypothetical protein